MNDSTPTQYSQAPQPAHVPQPPLVPRTDGLAIAAFVCALCGLGLIPVILGHISLKRIKSQGLGGQGFAITGLILGYLTLATAIIVLVFVAVSIFWSLNA